jgi:hypothetical protein
LVQNAREFIKDYTWEKNKGVYLDLVDKLVAPSGRQVTARV